MMNTFMTTVNGLILRLWGMALAHPWVLVVSLAVILALAWLIRRPLVKYATAVAQFCEPTAMNLLLVASAVNSAYEGVKDQKEGRFWWAAVLFLAALYQGWKDRKGAKAEAVLQLDDSMKTLREQVIRHTGDETVQVYLYLNRSDVLTLEAASRHPFLKPTFKFGEGVSGLVAESGMTVLVDMVAVRGKTYAQFLAANKQRSVFKANRDQWQALRDQRDYLGVPIKAESGWVIGVVVLSSLKPRTENGFGKDSVLLAIDTTLRLAMKAVSAAR